VNVFSPWGKTRSLKLDINPDISIDQFKKLLNDELHLNAKTIKVELENEDAFGKNLEAGTLKSNGCKNNSTVTITSVDIEYGNQVHASHANSQVFTDRFDPSHSADAWREHAHGVNYEAECPSVPDRKVIINRGFGTFDWATDPLELTCSCCHQKVDPRTVKRVSVNHCEWTFGGITDDGEKVRNSGVTQDQNQWIIDGSKPWRKLFIRAIDPHIPAPKKNTLLITCALCKLEFGQDRMEIIANRQLCPPCAIRVRQSLADRERSKSNPDQHHVQHEEETPQAHSRHVQENKVHLPGLGQQIELRRIFRPSKGGGGSGDNQ